MLEAEICYNSGMVYGYRQVPNTRESLEKAREELKAHESGMKYVIYKDLGDPVIVERLNDGSFKYDRPSIGQYNQSLKKAQTWWLD